MALTISIISLVLALSVAIAQLWQWRHGGSLVRCDLTRDDERVVVRARNVGRGSCDLAGFGFLMGELEYPWITDVATRYWPGAGRRTSGPLVIPFPCTLSGRTGRAWYVPLDELREAQSAFGQSGRQIRAYVLLAAGGRKASRQAL